MPTRKGFLTSVPQLIRLPNVFTAPSDVAMGMAVSGAALTSSHAVLLLASACASSATSEAPTEGVKLTYGIPMSIAACA